MKSYGTTEAMEGTLTDSWAQKSRATIGTHTSVHSHRSPSGCARSGCKDTTSANEYVSLPTWK